MVRRRRQNGAGEEEAVDFSGGKENGAPEATKTKKNRFGFGRKSSKVGDASKDDSSGKKGSKWGMPKMPSKNNMTMMMMKNGGAGAALKMAMK